MDQIDRNKDIVRRYIAEIFVAGNTAAVDDLVAEDFVQHGSPASTGDPRADLRQTIERVGKGLADPEFVIHDLIAEGDRVAVRLTASATHVGEFMGMPATNKRYTIEEIHVFRVRDGLVAEHWHDFNPLAMMQQLGIKPGG
ncbi:MAG TPA: ester cyclase [Candidatus Limnocylindrales bacterium]|jgi:steroid delta-isomerase-like uncharacterized protein